MRADDSEESGFFLRFDFRGFEVKMVELELATEGSFILNLRSKSPHLYLLILLPMSFCRNGHSWVAIDKLHSLVADLVRVRNCCDFIPPGQFQWNCCRVSTISFVFHYSAGRYILYAGFLSLHGWGGIRGSPHGACLCLARLGSKMLIFLEEYYSIIIHVHYS